MKQQSAHGLQRIPTQHPSSTTQLCGRLHGASGFDMRTAIKRTVMTAYCRGLAPAWLVTFVFRVFRLKHV